MQPDPNSVAAFVDYLRANSPEHFKMLFSQTDEEFDEGLEELLEKAADYLEKNANHLAMQREDGITMSLVAYLTGVGLRALQQAHSNGHVDITIEADNSSRLRRRLGEAKIYDGPAYHVKGLEQLIDRYSTGRERSGFMVEYVKKPKIKDLVENIRSYMDSTKPCAQDGNSQDHQIRWAFTTNHEHSSGELLRVLHLNCNLHRPGVPEETASS